MTLPGVHGLGLFVVSAVLLNLTPGPDTLFILGQAARGARAGSLAALGIGAGCLVHIAAATVGLSALLVASASAFLIVKLAGAVYLVWIGLSMLRQGAPPAAAAGAAEPGGGARIFLKGALTNALNPKVAMFFLAFLPQFVDTAGPHRALAFFALGCLFNLTGTLWNLALAQLGAGAVRRSKRIARRADLFVRGVGALFVLLGLKLAFAARRVA